MILSHVQIQAEAMQLLQAMWQFQLRQLRPQVAPAEVAVESVAADYLAALPMLKQVRQLANPQSHSPEVQ